MDSITSSTAVPSGRWIREYNNKIQSGEIVACRKIKVLYRKLVYDLDHQVRWNFDDEKAQHVIDFIEMFCRNIKGKHGKKRIVLELWQKAMISAAFGFVDDDGLRRFRELILIIARKNGKSLISAALALYLLICDGEMGPEIVCAATMQSQARIIWENGAQMIQWSPELSKKCKVLTASVRTKFNVGTFKPVSSESHHLDGLNLHGFCLDELHEIKDPNLYHVLVDSMSAREQPMAIITTTAGMTQSVIFDMKYAECERILNGYFDENGYHDDRVLPVVYELDKRSEWRDPGCWRKANPGLGTIKNIDILESKVTKAKADQLLEKDLLVKDFDVRDTSIQSWLTFEQLNNEATFSLDELKPKYGLAGVDLSTTTDLTSSEVLFMVPNDTTVYVLSMFWIPEDLLEQREATDSVPYSQWRDMGLLRVTPGNKVDYRHIVAWYEELRTEHGLYLYSIGYDSWSAEYFVQELRDLYGKNTPEPVPQGKKTLSAPMKLMASDLSSKLINYNNNPILKWCLSNVSIDVDKNDNIQPCKGRDPRKRIDGAAALLDAYVQLERHRPDYVALI